MRENEGKIGADEKWTLSIIGAVNPCGCKSYFGSKNDEVG